MSSVIDAIEVVLSIFAMIAVGMGLTKIGWIKQTEAAFISRFVVRVALPATIVNNIFGKFTAASLLGMAAGLVVPALGLLISMALGQLTAKMLKIERKRLGVFVVMFSFSNSVFIGLPVCRALFGEEAVPYTLIYYIANTTLFWTIGYSMMRADGGRAKEARSFRMIPEYLMSKNKADERFLPAKNALSILGKAVPLPLLFLLFSAACVLLGIRLPDFLMSAATYVGNTVTPISLVYTGYVLMRMITSRHFHWEKGYFAIVFGKFILTPLIVIGLVKLFSLSGEMARLLTPIMVSAFVIEAAMPVMTQTTIVEANCGGDDEYAAGGTALTTALSLLFIPLYMFVITTLL